MLKISSVQPPRKPPKIHYFKSQKQPTPCLPDMPFLLVFNKATDAAETLLLFTVCPAFLEVHSSLSLSWRLSSLGWKHCSRHDLILLRISGRDSLFSQGLLEALVREKLEEKSKVWEELEEVFSISGSICLKTGSCSVDIRSMITLIKEEEENHHYLILLSSEWGMKDSKSPNCTFHPCQSSSLQILYTSLGL